MLSTSSVQKPFSVPTELCNITDALSLGSVTQAVDKLKERLGVSESIEVKESKTPYEYCSSSSGQFPWVKERSHITVNLSSLSSCTPGEREFILLHELRHIKNRDSRTGFYVKFSLLPELLAGYALVVRFTSTASPFIQLAGMGLAWLATRVTRSIFEQFQEMRADKEAFIACSNEGKLGAMTFFKRMDKEEKEFSLASRVVGYSLVFFRSGLEHPFIPVRLRYIQALAQQTGVSRESSFT
jgi:Zn-dependent protease with chaperone function